MDLLNGGKVLEKLEQSSVWSSYKDQKHDLFLEVFSNYACLIFDHVTLA